MVKVGCHMKNIMIYSMVDFMQVGLNATVIEASSLHLEKTL
ncbi:hypothetical protein Ga0466249_000724 [Sporomusaceae bacterium BoRhaA]|nr:hypothetical protein [Pelorhabdus rhamnosifermentans]